MSDIDVTIIACGQYKNYKLMHQGHELNINKGGRAGGGGGGGGMPPSRLTHPLLPCAKQNLSILPVCNSLLFIVLNQKHASFIIALLEIDYFPPVVHPIFTDELPLISGRGLKFARALTSWPPHIKYASATYDYYYYYYYYY